MKRAVLTTMVAGVLMAGGIGSCQGGPALQGTEQSADSAADGIRTQAAEELKKVFSDEIAAFFKSDDLSKTLGIDSGGQAELEESIKTYIEHYSMDEEKLSEAKESLDTLLQNAEGLSAEELQNRVEGIFAE